jgi:hypothetical protein
VRVGMEATGHCRWFECLLSVLNYELWVGDPAQIRATVVLRPRDSGERSLSIEPASILACQVFLVS